MKNWGIKVLAFLKKNWLSELLILVTIFVAGFILWDSFSAGTSNPLMGKLRPKPVPQTVTDPISGRQVSAEQANKRPVAVVIENSPAARPHSGLNKADLVFETFAEGGITRFMAIFQENDYKEIGPIRSARPYFVNWAAAYGALFAHVGGSLDALALIPRSGVYDLNQFYFGSYFWRDSARYAPHNVYSTIAKLTQAAQSKNYPINEDNVPAFSFKTDAKTTDRPVAFSVNVNFNYSFGVTWKYQPKDNNFYRSMSGVAQTDRISGEQIMAKNLMVCFSDFGYGLNADGVQKVDIRTTGSGTAYIFIDGTKKVGTWQRSEGKILRFFDGSGSEIKLNPGTTWVDYVPNGTSVN